MMAASFQLPNLPREEKLSYIESHKRKLVEYIKYLDDVAAQQHNEDLRPPPSTSSVVRTTVSPSDTRRRSGVNIPGAATALPTQFTEDGFEAVNPEDFSTGSILATGTKTPDDVTRRGWFSSWGSGARSASDPQTPQ
jgi:hypothetical protein